MDIEEIRQITSKIATADKEEKKRQREAHIKPIAEKLGIDIDIYMHHVMGAIQRAAEQGRNETIYSAVSVSTHAPKRSTFFKTAKFPDGVNEYNILELISYNLDAKGYETCFGRGVSTVLIHIKW